MKKILLIVIAAASLSLAACSGNKVDGRKEQMKDSAVTQNDSIKTRAGAPPKDSVLADTTTNAPKMAGQ